jgi:Rrf2 family iron-sulfur cluster assembly transcriptional regulator
VKINNKAKIATVSMIRLALVGDKGPVSLGELSVRQGQSVSYLEQVFSKLMKAGLVKSVRGPGGGYRVASLDTSVSDIILAVTGELPEPAGDDLPEVKLWADLSQQTHEFWNSRTLADLIL